jgi:hypothetical protein
VTGLFYILEAMMLENQTYTAKPLPQDTTLEEQIRRIVQEEIESLFNVRIATLEQALTKAQANMNGTIQAMSEALASEMDRLQENYKQQVLDIAIDQIRNRAYNN